ncbi:MAG: PepSY domain-containing protein, partial [Stackebrandtia sp.]
MSLLSNRRALVVAGLTGMLLAGGALASSTAAFADDGSASDDSTSTPSTGVEAPADSKLTIADAADTAQAEYPECAVTAALFYDSGETPSWDVELTCDSGTTKYLTVDADDGSITNKADGTDDADQPVTDPNDAAGTGDNADYS